jgi:chromate transporter
MPPPLSYPSFVEALRFWLHLGCVSFGGPAGQIAILHRELVERRAWISERRFAHALNYCMLLPGPEAQQLATYLGWLLHGVRGGVAAGVLFVLPSLLLLTGLSWLYMAFGAVPLVATLLYGVKPVVVAIVACAMYRLGRRVLDSVFLWMVALAGSVALALFHIPFPILVAAAGGLGWMADRVAPKKLLNSQAMNTMAVATGNALIDDGTPVPPHAKWHARRLVGYAAVGILLWVGAMALLVLRVGWDNTLTQMAWFFSKAALVTFGGAYAVLPYVQQAAVDQYGWLTPGQILDGMALGETTPGPLIMVVAFIGFVGAWTHAPLGAQALLTAATLGAVVATFFTFLPSFLFILMGGPLVEATRGEWRWLGPLTAITALVVGVMLNLALYFAHHVFIPAGGTGRLDLYALAVAVLGVWVLSRWQPNPAWLVVGGATLGLLHGLALNPGA